MIVDNDKKLRLKESFAATKAKRKTQECHVRTVKIQDNKLTCNQREWLKMNFVEAKWLYNHVLNLNKNGTDIFAIDYTDIPEVGHFNKDGAVITTSLTYLPAQSQQEVIKGMKSSIKTLATLKARGLTVGSLDFISEYNSINLKQCGVSYKIVSKNKVKLQGCKKPFKVNGLKQLVDLGEYELSNARLIRKSSGYYIAFTCYIAKKKPISDKPLMGVDFGCTASLTLSDGHKYDCVVEEDERIKKLRRAISHSLKLDSHRSNNRQKLYDKLEKAYEHLTNRKNDAARKIVSRLNDYKIIMQDEQICKWRSNGHGRKVQHGILGRVKSLLMSRHDTIVISKWCPTTKLCTECGEKVDIGLKDRIFICPTCGHTEDRDIHAACNMIWFYRNNIGVGRTEFTPADLDSFLLKVNSRLKQEAANSLD